MEKLKVTPKDFFLWAGAMVALYIAVISYLALLFSYIDFAFPDALDSYVDPYSSGMRFSMAAILVLFPLYLYLMYLIRNDITAQYQKSDLWVRRWALVLTIFVAGFTIAGDLITLINYFLGGEVTVRFFLKVVVVLLVAGGALLHFIADIKGFWIKKVTEVRLVGIGVGILLVASIGAGFLIMGSPGQVRLYRFDDQKVSDLQNIQYQIINYWQQKEKLPVTLAELNDPLSGWTIPGDPQGTSGYTYMAIDKLSFKLCATFNAETQPNSQYVSRPMMAAPAVSGAKGPDLNALPWTHTGGETCFTRTIDPQRYPPYNKKI